MDTFQRGYVMVKGLFLLAFLNATTAWYPAETDSSSFVVQLQENVHDIADRRFSASSPSKAC